MPGVNAAYQVSFRALHRTCYVRREGRRHDGERHDQRQRQRKHALCGKRFFGFCHRVKTPLSESKSVGRLGNAAPKGFCHCAPARYSIWRGSHKK